MKPAFIKRILTACVAGALLLSTMAMSAFAKDITDQEHNFTLTGTRSFRPDLFGSKTKNMMPGDSVTFNVQLKNQTGSAKEIFMRALETETNEEIGFDSAAKEVSDKLLGVLTMEIVQIVDVSAPSSNQLIYTGSVDGKTPQSPEDELYHPEDPSTPKPGTTGWDDTIYVSLGNVAANSNIILQVTVTVPLGISQEFQGARGLTDWEFGWYTTQIDSSGRTGGTTEPPFERIIRRSDPSTTANITDSSAPVTVIEEFTEPPVPLDNVIVIEIPDEKLPLTGTIGMIMSNTAAVSAVVLVLLGACIITTIKLRRQRLEG